MHTHIRPTLKGCGYTYTPREIKEQETDCVRTFMGYQREDGSVGIRNKVWIITVGCVNKVAQQIAKKTGAELCPSIRLLAA